MEIVVIVLAVLTAIVSIIHIVSTRKNRRQEKVFKHVELLCGYWEPMECNRFPLEIFKYCVIVQWWVNEDGEKFEKSRERYIINGHWLYVGDSIQCAFKVYEKEGITYLELYGDDDYAGKYRKS